MCHRDHSDFTGVVFLPHTDSRARIFENIPMFFEYKLRQVLILPSRLCCYSPAACINRSCAQSP